MTPRYTLGYKATVVLRALADLFVVHEIPATLLGVCGRRRCSTVATLGGANSARCTRAPYGLAPES